MSTGILLYFSNVAFIQHIWRCGWDLNPRFYSFADCSIGPLWHHTEILAETVGIEPTHLLSQVYRLAICCITSLPNLLHGSISMLSEINFTTFCLNTFNNIFKKNRSVVCLFHTYTMVSDINFLT